MSEKSKRTLAIILALIGTVLVWLPIVAPLFFTLALLIRTGEFRLDWLMPAELFSLALAGAAALIAAAILARSRLKLIAGSLALALGMLVGGQALAVITGLASGDAEPNGWQWALVVAAIAIYTLSVVMMGVGGVLLLRDLFRRRRLLAEGQT